MSNDPIFSLLQTAYTPKPTNSQWLLDILQQLQNVAQYSGGGIGYFYHTRASAERKVPVIVATGPAEQYAESIPEWLQTMTAPALFQLMANQPVVHTTVSLANQEGPPLLSGEFKGIMEHFNVNDTLSLNVMISGEQGLMLSLPHATVVQLSSAQKSRWRRIGVHLGAAARLQQALQKSPPTDDARYTPDGTLLDSPNTLSDKAVLREIAINVQRRTQAFELAQQQNTSKALEIWEGLVLGRWSLLDHFDTNGKHFVVVRENEPTAEDPRGLSKRERIIAQYLARGYSNKLIGYTLGISTGTVGSLVARIFAKLGCNSRVELINYLSVGEHVESSTTVNLGEEQLAILTAKVSQPVANNHLTDTEKSIVQLALEGKSNQEIAQARGCSTQTVGNQLSTIYKKLGIQSRSQLIGRSEKDEMTPNASS